MNFKHTFIRLKDSDQTVKRIKEIAYKYSLASGCKLEWYLKSDYSTDWDFIGIKTDNLVIIRRHIEDDLKEITEQDLDDHLAKNDVTKYDLPTIGSLVENLYTIMPSSDAVTISVRGNGQIVLEGTNIPAIEVTQLEAEEITETYKAMVLLENLFVREDFYYNVLCRCFCHTCI